MTDDRIPGVQSPLYVVDMGGGRSLFLTGAQVDAAKLKKKRAASRNRKVDPAVEAIADARPQRHVSETEATTPVSR